jgi:hypothetical protein
MVAEHFGHANLYRRNRRWFIEFLAPAPCGRAVWLMMLCPVFTDLTMPKNHHKTKKAAYAEKT